MYIVHFACQCGHYGSCTDERVVKAHMNMEKLNGRCTKCGAQNRFTTVIGWDTGAHPVGVPITASPAPGSDVKDQK